SYRHQKQESWKTHRGCRRSSPTKYSPALPWRKSRFFDLDGTEKTSLSKSPHTRCAIGQEQIENRDYAKPAFGAQAPECLPAPEKLIQAKPSCQIHCYRLRHLFVRTRPETSL